MNADLASWLVVLPLLVALGTVVATVLLAGRPRAQTLTGLAGALALLASSLTLCAVLDGRTAALTVAFGGWDLPFAIAFVADRLGAVFVAITAVMVVATSAFQSSRADTAPASPTLVPLIHAFAAGAVGAFLTGDLFNLYVWFEVGLVASLGLLVHGNGVKPLDAAFSYFVLNVMGTLFVLLGVALVHAVTGQLNYAALSQASSLVGRPALVPAIVVVFVGLGLKAGGFPLFAWLPASYHTLPAPILALFAAVGTKIGVYAILRLQGAVFRGVAVPDEVWGWIAVATMMAGVLGAAWHWDIRRILAFHSVSQVGYMLLGIALGSVPGTQAALVFAVHHSLVKANLFLLAGIVRYCAGSYDLRRIGGLQSARPWLAALFLSQALSLVGIPPTSGFWAKLLVVRESLAGGHVGWAAAALGVGALTMYSMVKIWMEAFWKPHPDAGTPRPDGRLWPAVVVTCGLALLTTIIGLWPEPLLRFTFDAAEHLHGGSAR